MCSKDLNKVLWFYSKLFNSKPSINQLANKGFSDWKNLSAKPKSHETSNEHITNMITWLD